MLRKGGKLPFIYLGACWGLALLCASVAEAAGIDPWLQALRPARCHWKAVLVRRQSLRADC